MISPCYNINKVLILLLAAGFDICVERVETNGQIGYRYRWDLSHYLPIVRLVLTFISQAILCYRVDIVELCIERLAFVNINIVVNRKRKLVVQNIV